MIRKKALCLLTALLLVGGLFVGPVQAGADDLNANEKKLYALTEEDRTRYGKPGLILDAELCRAARLKAEDMLENGYFSHESPTYGRVGSLLNALDISFVSAGENIARYRDIDRCEAGFLSSPPHRRNLLGAGWTHMGVGAVETAEGFVYAVQIFIRR